MALRPSGPLDVTWIKFQVMVEVQYQQKSVECRAVLAIIHHEPGLPHRHDEKLLPLPNALPPPKVPPEDCCWATLPKLAVLFWAAKLPKPDEEEGVEPPTEPNVPPLEEPKEPNPAPPVDVFAVGLGTEDPNAGDPPKVGELPNLGGEPKTGAAPKPGELPKLVPVPPKVDFWGVVTPKPPCAV